jgi:DSF synthase
MLRIADLWVEAALKLSEADLRKMTRLAMAQDRRRSRQEIRPVASGSAAT